MFLFLGYCVFFSFKEFWLDWGPSYPAQGIWKPMYLVGLEDSVHIDEFIPKVFFKDGKFVIKVCSLN
jgi:hypothetical protein